MSKFKVRPKFVKYFTFGFARAITLWPFGIYLKYEKDLDNQWLKNHEETHWKQQKEMLGIFFYIWYLVEWFIRIFINTNAYKNISFEREAKQNERKRTYLKKRKHYSSFKYIKE